MLQRPSGPISAGMFEPKYIRIDDPLIEIQSRHLFTILKGGPQTTDREFYSTSYSQSSTVFSVPPPNPTTFVSRRFLLKVPVRITITNAANVQQNPWVEGAMALRSHPIASIMRTLEVTLNGASTTLQVNDVIKPLLLFHNNERDLGNREMSMAPALRDQSQEYDMLWGYVRNPLGSFGDAGPDKIAGRGGFAVKNYSYAIVNNTGVLTIDYDLVEELLISPLLFGGVRDQAFIGLQKVDVAITWDDNLEKVFSVNTANMWPGTTFSVDIAPGKLVGEGISQPSMMFRYVTPPLTLEIPRSIQYSYNEIRRYIKDISSTAAAYPAHEYTVIHTDNIQLNAIPRFLYIYARPSNAYLSNSTNNVRNSLTSPDAYFAIRNLTVNWNNQNALLSNANRERLYDISRKNGIDCSWTEFAGSDTLVGLGGNNGPPGVVRGIGSVICLEFGTDVGLREDECPGLIGTYNLQLTLEAKNLRNVQFGGGDWSLYMITITPGIFTIYDNAANKRIGVVNREEAFAAVKLAGYDYYSLQKNLMSGGFKFRPLKWLRKAASVVKKAAPWAKTIAPQYSPLIDAAVTAANLIPEEEKKEAMDILQEAAPSGGAYVGGYYRKRAKRRKGKKPGPKKRRGGMRKKKVGGKMLPKSKLVKLSGWY